MLNTTLGTPSSHHPAAQYCSSPAAGSAVSMLSKLQACSRSISGLHHGSLTSQKTVACHYGCIKLHHEQYHHPNQHNRHASGKARAYNVLPAEYRTHKLAYHQAPHHASPRTHTIISKLLGIYNPILRRLTYAHTAYADGCIKDTVVPEANNGNLTAAQTAV
jgi:hypothetical protein